MLLLRGHQSSVRSLTFSPDGTLLASAGDDRKVVLWDARTGHPEAELLGHTDCVQAVAFSPNGQRVYSVGDDRHLNVWGMEGGKVLFTVGPSRDRLVALAVSPDGGLIAVGGDRLRGGWYGGRVDESATLRFIDAFTGRTESPFPTSMVERTQPVWSLAFARQGQVLAAALSNGEVVLWDCQKARVVRRLLHSVAVRALAFSPDGKTLVTAPGTPVQVWDLRSETVRHKLGEIRHSIESLAFAPDNVTLVTGCLDSTVRLWDTRTGLEKVRFDWRLGRVHAVAIAPDGMTAAAAGDNGDIIIWDLDL